MPQSGPGWKGVKGRAPAERLGPVMLCARALLPHRSTWTDLNDHLGELQVCHRSLRVLVGLTSSVVVSRPATMCAGPAPVLMS
jgi:hypothetical protein